MRPMVELTGKRLGVFVVALSVSFLIPLTGHGAELRTFELPSEKKAPVITNRQAPLKEQQSRPESVYDRFRKDISGMEKTRKVKLRTGLEEKRKNAIDKSEWDDAKYYDRLIAILEENLDRD